MAKNTSKKPKPPKVELPSTEYWKLRRQGKKVNALDVRCARDLTQVGSCLFIHDGRAVIIYGKEDPNGREWDRLNDLMLFKRHGQRAHLLQIEQENQARAFHQTIEIISGKYRKVTP